MPKTPKSTPASIAAREDEAKELRRGIRAAQLRVALDKQRGRTTPAAVVRVANRKLPEVNLFIKSPIVDKSPRMTFRPKVRSVIGMPSRRIAGAAPQVVVVKVEPASHITVKAEPAKSYTVKAEAPADSPISHQ